MIKLLVTSGVLAATALMVNAANLLAPGDAVLGGQIVGENFEIGVVGTAASVNNWPEAEPPTAIIDGVGQKYLNFGELNTGVVVTPSAPSIVTSMTLWTANDAVERDPTSFELWGTNVDVSGDGPLAVSAFTAIGTGDLSLPETRNAGGDAVLDAANSQTVTFENTTTYTSYMIIFPTVKDETAANSMQIAEIQLDGTVIPEPATTSLLLCGLGAFVLRRKRREG